MKFVILFLSLYALSLSAGITRGPYLQRVGADQLVLRWRTSEPVLTAASLSKDGSTWKRYAVEGEPTKHHSLAIDGLCARTAYHYRIEGRDGSIVAQNEDWCFRTAPTPGESASMRFWALGDFGTGNAHARAVRDAFVRYNAEQTVDAWLMLGDNAYEKGSDDEFQRKFFETYPKLLSRIPAFSTRGNHERDVNVYEEIVTNPTKGELGGVPSGTEAYYSFDYGNVHFVCLDSFGSDRSANGLMMKWLKADLLSTSADWIIAFFHHPPYTKGTHDSDNPVDSAGAMEEMRMTFLPVLEAAGTDLVLSGHSHAYERSYPIHGHYDRSGSYDPATMQKADHAGDPDQSEAYTKNEDPATIYVVNGSGGKLGRKLGDHPIMVCKRREYGSVIIDVDGKRLEAIFLNKDAQVRDRYVIEHR